MNIFSQKNDFRKFRFSLPLMLYAYHLSVNTLALDSVAAIWQCSWHRRRKRGARGVIRPPKFQVGGHRTPNFTHCLHNELHCSIVVLQMLFLICVH